MTNNENLETTITTIKQDQKTVQQDIQSIIVSNDEQMDAASEILSKVKARINRVEEKRKEYVQPLNVQVRKINADFKEVLEPYKIMEEVVKGRIGAYVTEQRKIQEQKEREERERQREEARKLAEKEKISAQKAAAQLRKVREEKEALMPKEEAPKTSVKTETAKVVTKVVMKFEVTDSSKVPDEFKVVDEKLIRKAVNAGAKRIAGVRIYEETQVSAF